MKGDICPNLCLSIAVFLTSKWTLGILMGLIDSDLCGYFPPSDGATSAPDAKAWTRPTGSRSPLSSNSSCLTFSTVSSRSSWSKDRILWIKFSLDRLRFSLSRETNSSNSSQKLSNSTAVTMTWIQISRQNWNGFSSNASHQIMISYGNTGCGVFKRGVQN